MSRKFLQTIDYRMMQPGTRQASIINTVLLLGIHTYWYGAVPVDCIILPPKVDFAKSHPLRTFKTPFWRAHALQRHSLGPSKPSQWATTHVV